MRDPFGRTIQEAASDPGMNVAVANAKAKGRTLKEFRVAIGKSIRRKLTGPGAEATEPQILEQIRFSQAVVNYMWPRVRPTPQGPSVEKPGN